METDLPDDSWSDGIKKAPNKSPHVSDRDPISGPLEDDSWADSPPTRRVVKIFDDSWADSVRSPATIARHPLARMDAQADSPTGLEDDSWADEPARAVSSETRVVAAEESAAPSGPGTVETPSGPGVSATDGATVGVRWQRRDFYPPEIPQQYTKFSGRVEEVRLEDPAAEVLFREIFSRKRLEAEFPGAVGLPLLVGLDFEWKPDRQAWDNNPIAVMQLACWDTALILRTDGCKVLPEWMKGFLEDPDTIKVTAGFDVSDKDKLMKSFSWDFDERAVASSFADIAELARTRDIPYGVQRMAKFFDLEILKLKVVGCSNWAKASEKGLSSLQRDYAADDPFVQLYLLGKLLEHTRPDKKDVAMCRVLSSWQATLPGMQKVMQLVDNSEYRRCFYELRDVLKEAVGSLSNALGSNGCATINQMLYYKPVQQVLNTFQKQGSAVLTVNNSFLKQNCDLFKIFFRDGELKVRLREPDEDDDDEEDTAAGQDQEATKSFLSEVLEKLVAYKPPIGKQATPANRVVPEAEWVPARAILTKRQSSQLEFCARTTDALQVASSDGDGLIVRMVRHPRASDGAGHTRRSAASLAATLGIAEEEATRRIESDTKFAQMRNALQILEAGSKDEAHVERSLRARVRILSDAARLAEKVAPPVSWEEARDSLEKVKCYRQLCGEWLQAGAARVEEAIDECISAVAQAWPDVAGVKVEVPKRGREAGSSGAAANGGGNKRQRRR